MAGRLTLGLYNCYDPKQWQDIMRITLARAGPVALAFDCDLATFGFPYEQARARGATKTQRLEDAKAVAGFVADSTSIGEAGDGTEAGTALTELAGAKRFHLLPFPQGDFPMRMGMCILTTPAPAPGKRTLPLEVARELAADRDALLVFGLGPRGLPAGLLAYHPRHLELTGKGISLETATALGALPAMIATHLAHLEGRA